MALKRKYPRAVLARGNIWTIPSMLAELPAIFIATVEQSSRRRPLFIICTRYYILACFNVNSHR